jgi:predicted NBD/HSP70 family sugar kinase
VRSSDPLAADGRPDPAVTVFDVGGTHVRCGRWHGGDGDRVRDHVEHPSPSLLREPDATVPELRDRLVRMLCEAVPTGPGPVAGISLGAALDHRTGRVYASAPLWGDREEPFDLRRALVRRRPDVSWHLVNDVTAALLHYASAPACRDRRKILLVTVSSGVACRLLDRGTGRIAVDGCGLQGEIGHLPAHTVLAGAPVELDCDCGRPGHVASFASGPGIRRMAALLRERDPRAWESSAIARAERAGRPFETALRTALDIDDAVARTLLTAAVRPLADLLATALSLDPAIDRIGLTGGVATGLGRHYRRIVTALILESGPYLTREREPGWVSDRVTLCAPGEANGLVGAGLAALSAEHGTRRGGPR